MTLRRLLCVLAVFAATLLSHPAFAQQVDVVRGRVTGPDRAAIEDAQITVTSVSGGVNRNARSDKNGRFTVTIPGGDGDYFIAFQAIGFAPRRFEVKRVADEDFLLADAQLQRSAAQLDAVKVTAERERVSRRDANAPDISGTEKTINNAAVAAAQAGDLAAMASSLPGVTPVAGADGDPAGFSVLGLSADQNNTQLNGMNFGGSNLPRDAAVSTSLTTSPYDVSRGGFSGAQFSLRTSPGTNYLRRSMSLNLDAPQLQWTDAAARALGQQYTNASLGGLVSGPLKYDKAFYNVSYQLGRQANDLRTLLNTDPVGLQATGIAADSVSRLTGILGQAKVPTLVGRLPNNRLSDRGSLFGAFDFTPPSSSTGQSFNVTLNGNWNKQTPASSLTTEFPAHSGDRTNWQAGAQARHSSYWKNIFLTESSLGVNQSRNYATPYLTLPSGTVRVNSTFADGTSGLQQIAFGGSPSMNTSQTSTSLAFTNQLSWFSENNKHRLKLTSELRRDGYTLDQTSNLYGSFSYNSLTDLQAGRPASFTRALSPRERSGSQVVGALSLGDSYKRTRDLQLQYGVRLDANRFFSEPNANPEVERIFGTRNDAVPNRIYVSPRVGFSWTYGTAPQIAGFDGAVRGPRAVVRGGAGVFQNTPMTTLIGNAVDNTGLASAVQQITCVGIATPTPDWNAYLTSATAIPDRCADGTTGSVFANSAPNVALLAKNYTAPRSIRSNLQWSGPVLANRFSLSVEGTYSLNLNQTSILDLNFSPTTRFSLADEGGRPVFVQPSSIVPTTGAIASRDARVSPLFSRVNEQRSDMRSESKQLRLGLNPATFSTNFSWGLNYVYSNVRDRTRGFTSTVGNPLDVAWARSSFDARHQLVYNLSYNFLDALRVSWYGNVRSGTPYTPTIIGDVNGDGSSFNDRAFVFDPASTTDGTVAKGIQSLLDDGSSGARACLRSQLGALAGRNSCAGPWTHSANLSISFNPLKVRMPQRATLSFSVSNPLGAADLLLHGEDKLRGWGQSNAPDQSLLYVRGFDPATGRYKYEVNQRFGSTSPQQSAFRQPVTVTAQLRFDVGPTRERQNLTQTLDRGRRHEGSKAPEQMLKIIYGSGGITNPMAQILRQSDTLKLDGRQADSIATMNRRYVIALDSIWSPLAKEFAGLPDDYDQGDVYGRYRDARRASVDLLIRIAPDIKSLLTADQRRKLPPFISSFLDQRYLASIRSGTAGSSVGGSPMMMGGAGGFAPAGGGERVIIRGP